MHPMTSLKCGIQWLSPVDSFSKLNSNTFQPLWALGDGCVPYNWKVLYCWTRAQINTIYATVIVSIIIDGKQ